MKQGAPCSMSFAPLSSTSRGPARIIVSSDICSFFRSFLRCTYTLAIDVSLLDASVHGIEARFTAVLLQSLYANREAAAHAL